MKRVLILLASIIAAGCAKNYVEPDAALSAKVTFVNTDSSGMTVNPFKDASDCSYQMIIGDNELIAQGNDLTINVKGGEEFAFLVVNSEYIGNGYSICKVVGSFMPERGREYIASFARSNGHCMLSVTKRTNDSIAKSAYIPEPSFRLRNYKRAAFGPKGNCE